MKTFFDRTAFVGLAFLAVTLLSSCIDPSRIAIEPGSDFNDTIAKVDVSTDSAGTGATLDPASSEDIHATTTKLQFSGYSWLVRSSGYEGPGLNLFSNRRGNVWVDADGNLHLRVTYYKGKWYSAEVYSEDFFSYGEYAFYVSSRVDTLDKNVVLGLFTWNNNSFQTDGNSEIDIEFARWGIAGASTLEYSVQPTAWDGYSERFHYPSNYNQSTNFTTHTFIWTPTQVRYRSYYGHGNPTSSPAGSWTFDQSAGKRRKIVGADTSDLVGIPSPGTSTRVHMNLWLHDTNFDGFGDAPSNGQEVEVIIKKFEYTPR